MATAVEPKKAGSRPETFVEEQLTAAAGRVRTLDLASTTLAGLAALMAYALAVIALDRWLDLPQLARQALFAMFGLGMLVYLGVRLARPLLLTVNPYYAARRVEETIPSAKNSLVNYLDLRDAPLSPAIRQAVGIRAARDLKQADLTQAIDGRSLARNGIIAGVLAAGLMAALIALKPGPFTSLLSRAFFPFTSTAIATRTQIVLVEPSGGNVTVPLNSSVAVAVRVEGKVPDPKKAEALRLRYRYSPEAAYEERLLDMGASNREWGTRMPPHLVQNGFWYKVAGGDSETPEYRVSVRSQPGFTGFEVTSTPRPYLRQQPTTSRDPNLEGFRGTAVVLVARTNRVVREGGLQIEGERHALPGERVPDQPDALRFRLVLEKDGKYTIRFTSTDGEVNRDLHPKSIKVFQDRVPEVDIIRPEDDVVRLPANGTLKVEGLASDDFGLTAMTLKLRQVGDTPRDLTAKPYRDGKDFQFENGAYPRRLEYQDFVALDQLRLEPGAEVEYWLEATDNCDYPAANVGKSLPRKFVVLPPVQDEELKQQEKERREQAKNDQKAHEKKQDEKLKQEAERSKAEDAARQQEQQAKNDKGDQGDKQNPGDPAEQKPGNQGQDQGQPNPDDRKTEQQANELAKKLGLDEKPGEGDKPETAPPPDDQPKGENKPMPGDKDGDPQPKPAEPKDMGEPGEGKQDPGEAKDDPKQEPGESKQKGNNPGGEGGGMGENAGENKPEPRNGGGQGAGENKSKGDPEELQRLPNGTGEAKPQKKDDADTLTRKPPMGQGDGKDDKKNGDQGGDQSGQPPPKKDNSDAEGLSKKKPPQGGADGEAGQDKPMSGDKPMGGQAGNEKPMGGDKPMGGQAGQDKPMNGEKPADGEKPMGQKPNGSSGEFGNEKPMPKSGDPNGDPNQGNQPGEPKGGQTKSQDNSLPQSGDEPAPAPGEPKGDGQNKPASNKDAGKDGESGKSPKAGEAKPEKGPKADNQNKTGPMPEGKQPDGGDGPGNDSLKPPQPASDPKGDGPKPQPGEGKADPVEQKRAEELAKQMRDGNAAEKEAAGKELEKMAREAKDPQARKKAADALKKKGQQPGGDDGKPEGDTGQQPGGDPKQGNGPGEKPMPKDGQPGEGPGQQPGGKKGPDSKPGDQPGDGDKPQGRADKKPQTPDKDDRGDGNEPGQPKPDQKPMGESPDGKGRSGKRPVSSQGEGAPEQGDRTQAGQGSGPGGDDTPAAVNEAYRRKAAEMQLEQFKKVPKEKLKEQNISEEEYERFLRSYEEMLKRKRAAETVKDDLNRATGEGRSAGNTGARKVEPGASDKPTQLEQGGIALPPPEFREAFREFSDELSRTTSSRKK